MNFKKIADTSFKQQKEASELQSMYRFNFFIIYAKYKRVRRKETKFT